MTAKKSDLDEALEHVREGNACLEDGRLVAEAIDEFRSNFNSFSSRVSECNREVDKLRREISAKQKRENEFTSKNARLERKNLSLERENENLRAVCATLGMKGSKLIQIVAIMNDVLNGKEPAKDPTP